jgi:hypothetical protein
MTMANPLIKPTVINDWCLRQPSHSSGTATEPAITLWVTRTAGRPTHRRQQRYPGDL